MKCVHSILYDRCTRPYTQLLALMRTRSCLPQCRNTPGNRIVMRQPFHGVLSSRSTRGPFGYSCVPQRAIGSAYALLRSNYAYKLLGFSAVQTNTLLHLWSALFFLFSFSPLPRLSVWVSSERSSIDGTTLITTGGRSVCLSIFSMERSHPTHA